MAAAPSIIDIARRAGVSKSTAARALSGDGAVSDAAHKKVHAAARAMKYRVNPAARALRKQDNRLLGIVTPDRDSRGMLSSAIAAQKLEGVAAGAKRLGYDLQIFIENLEDHERLRQLAVEKMVRAFFFLGFVDPGVLRVLDRYNIPWVGLNWRHPERPDDPYCWTDFPLAGRTLTHHLIDTGCRRVLAFDWLSPKWGPFGQGIADAWSARGKPARDLTLHVGAHFNAGAAVDEALDAALDSATPPDGLLMGYEGGTMSAYRALRARGLEPGRDVAVATFDDLNAPRYLDPPCTAYAQPTYQMGESAVEAIDRMLSAPRKHARIARAIPGELRVRASTQLFQRKT